ncbi:hypothetical protein Dimus_001444 [Dionaea muscipula]
MMLHSTSKIIFFHQQLTHPSSGDNLAVANLNAREWRQQIPFPRPGCVVDGLKMARSGSLDLVGVDGLKMGVGQHPWSARVQQRWRLRSRVGLVGLLRGWCASRRWYASRRDSAMLVGSSRGSAKLHKYRSHLLLPPMMLHSSSKIIFFQHLLPPSSSTNSSRTPSSGDNLVVADLNTRGWWLQIRFPRPGCVVDGLKMARSSQRRWVEDGCWSTSMVDEGATAIATSISGGRGWASASLMC